MHCSLGSFTIARYTPVILSITPSEPADDRRDPDRRCRCATTAGKVLGRAKRDCDLLFTGFSRMWKGSPHIKPSASCIIPVIHLMIQPPAARRRKARRSPPPAADAEAATTGLSAWRCRRSCVGKAALSLRYAGTLGEATLRERDRRLGQGSVLPGRSTAAWGHAPPALFLLGPGPCSCVISGAQRRPLASFDACPVERPTHYSHVMCPLLSSCPLVRYVGRQSP